MFNNLCHTNIIVYNTEPENLGGEGGGEGEGLSSQSPPGVYTHDIVIIIIDGCHQVMSQVCHRCRYNIIIKYNIM